MPQLNKMILSFIGVSARKQLMHEPMTCCSWFEWEFTYKNKLKIVWTTAKRSMNVLFSCHSFNLGVWKTLYVYKLNFSIVSNFICISHSFDFPFEKTITKWNMMFQTIWHTPSDVFQRNGWQTQIGVANLSSLAFCNIIQIASRWSNVNNVFIILFFRKFQHCFIVYVNQCNRSFILQSPIEEYMGIVHWTILSAYGFIAGLAQQKLSMAKQFELSVSGISPPSYLWLWLT